MKILYVNAIVAPQASQAFYEGVEAGLRLSSHATKLELVNFDLFNGETRRPWEIAPFVRAHNFDAVILSGSEKNTTDRQDPWVQEYLAGVREMLGVREGLNDDTLGPAQPILGICFGHQALACALGGDTSRFRRRTDFQRVKALPQSFNHPMFRKLLANAPAEELRELNVMVAHSDQVVRMPAHFFPLFGSDYCRVQGMAHDLWPVVSLQSHPEITSALKAIPGEAHDWTHLEASRMDGHHGPQILAAFLDWVATR